MIITSYSPCFHRRADLPDGVELNVAVDPQNGVYRIADNRQKGTLGAPLEVFIYFDISPIVLPAKPHKSFDTSAVIPQ